VSLNYWRRFVYDDVVLFASTDLDAVHWRLEVNQGRNGAWREVEARIGDAHHNWSSDDLELWPALREGDPDAVSAAFPEAGPAAPADPPFEIRWNVSNWAFGASDGGRYRYRFISPGGSEDSGTL
jgi:hypothetical protein